MKILFFLKIIKILNYKKVQFIVVFFVTIVFIAAPFIFSFEGLDTYYYWVIGIIVFIVVSMHKSEIAV